jgi:O-antigen biosynthesis protein WbqP
MYRRYVKRLIDVVLSLLGLVFASWLYLFIIIAIKIDDQGPVFFIQTRVGINKKEFKLVKFRSMKVSAPHDKATSQLENPEQHITRVGKFLRKTSLDEIPQLWNILKGDMSIIGPRPVIGNETELLNEREKYGVYTVKPGLSGWAQVNGRDLLGFEDKARLDGEYVEKMSFIFDCRCFFVTAVVALRRINIVEGAQVKMNKVNQISQIKQINKIEEKPSSEEMIV